MCDNRVQAGTDAQVRKRSLLLNTWWCTNGARIARSISLWVTNRRAHNITLAALRRNNIERHVWTQHVRDTLGFGAHVRYTAQYHKLHVDRYVAQSYVDMSADDINKRMAINKHRRLLASPGYALSHQLPADPAAEQQYAEGEHQLGSHAQAAYPGQGRQRNILPSAPHGSGWDGARCEARPIRALAACCHMARLDGVPVCWLTVLTNADGTRWEHSQA
jgi:hypothetical protein